MTRSVQRLADLRSQGDVWADFVMRWTRIHTSWPLAEEHWLRYIHEVTQLRELAHLNGSKLVAEAEIFTQRLLMIQIKAHGRCKFCQVRSKKRRTAFLAKFWKG